MALGLVLLIRFKHPKRPWSSFNRQVRLASSEMEIHVGRIRVTSERESEGVEDHGDVDDIPGFEVESERVSSRSSGSGDLYPILSDDDFDSARNKS